MLLHNKKLMFPVRVDEPNPKFAKMLLEQFGGPNGELAASMRYYTQAWADGDPGRRDMLLDIATEELSHLEMVAQTLVQLLKGTSGAMIDEVEGGYMGDLLDGKHEKFAGQAYMDQALGSGQTLLSGGCGLRLTDSMGAPWTSAYVDTIGQPTADLRSNVAAEARAKILYERLIKLTDDAGCKETLTFLMTREIAHQKMFEAALEAIPNNFPPGNTPGMEQFYHAYFNDSTNGKSSQAAGFALVSTHGDWGFELSDAKGDAAEAPAPQPHPSVASRPADGSSTKPRARKK